MSHEETEQDYSERMHRENCPHYISDDEIFQSIVNPSDWDNDETDDPSYWEEEYE